MPSKSFLNRRGSIWERTVFEGKSLPQLREEMDTAVMDELRLPAGIQVELGECGGISGRWVRPEQDIGKVIYYIHGGGFTLGSSGIPMPFLVELSKRLGVTCFSVDYRLAPEHVFPAAPEDALAAYKGLLDLGYEPENIAVTGESAGATLSLVLLLQCKQAGVALPCCAAAMSPVTDASPMTKRSGDKVLEDLPDTEQVWNQYAPKQDRSNPYISPALGNLQNLPPIFLLAGGAEPLVADALIYAEKAIEAGVDIQLKVGRDMIHTYPLDFMDYPEAMEAFEQMELFFRYQLKL